MVLYAEIRVLLKPPRRYLAFAYPTEERERRRLVRWVLQPGLGELGKVASKHLGTRAK
jgi:hypothetical protein